MVSDRGPLQFRSFHLRWRRDIFQHTLDLSKKKCHWNTHKCGTLLSICQTLFIFASISRSLSLSYCLCQYLSMYTYLSQSLHTYHTLECSSPTQSVWLFPTNYGLINRSFIPINSWLPEKELLMQYSLAKIINLTIQNTLQHYISW